MKSRDVVVIGIVAVTLIEIVNLVTARFNTDTMHLLLYIIFLLVGYGVGRRGEERKG